MPPQKIRCSDVRFPHGRSRGPIRWWYRDAPVVLVACTLVVLMATLLSAAAISGGKSRHHVAAGPRTKRGEPPVVSIAPRTVPANEPAPDPTTVPDSVASAPPPAPAAKKAPKVFGISFGDTLVWMSPTQLASALDDVVTLGATSVRLDLSWADVQPDGFATYDWANFDRVVSAAKARGLSLLPSLAYTPPWARPGGCESQMCAPADDAQFAAFARAAVLRYAPQGIHTWEIWNEENTPGFWKPEPDAAAYTRLLVQSVAAMRSVDSSAFVISGGLAATLSRNGAVDTRSFLAQMCALGANHVINAVGYHPYTYPYLPNFVAPWLTAWNKMSLGPQSFASTLAEFGTPHLPVWITEYGAPTSGTGAASDGTPGSVSDSTDHVTEALQAAIATESVQATLASPTVDALFWYTDEDDPGETSAEGFYGLRRSDGSPKPAFAALEQALHSAPS